MKNNPTLNELSDVLKKDVDLLLIAGEHSGDELAADLISELKINNPNLSIVGIGGAKMEALSVPLLFNLVNFSVFGFTDVLKNYLFFKTLLANVLDWIQEFSPKHICFIDYPGFNLRLAKELYKKKLSAKGGGSIRLHYYVSPQIWAWKAKRRFQMEKYLNSLATLLPFEKQFYEDTSLPVTYVGHPFAKDDYPLRITRDPKGPIVLLPGSREKSVKKLCPIILDTFKALRKLDPSLRACIIYPSNLIKATLEDIINDYPKPLAESIDLLRNDFDHLNCRMALMSSGTMSLSIALSGVPGTIIYSLSSLNYWILKFLMKVKFIGLANLILDEELYPELIQKSANSEQILKALKSLSDQGVEERFFKASQTIKELLNDRREMCVSEWLSSEMNR